METGRLRKSSAATTTTEYRAKRCSWTVGQSACESIDPYQDTEREAQRKLISNAFQAVFKIPHIQTFWGTDFFAADDGDCLVLVTDDIQGRALRQHIKKHNLPLDQKNSASCRKS